MSMLRFDHVSKRYPGGLAALTDVNFEVDSGEMLFVTGHSGAGKSTLLKLIHLTEQPTQGAVIVDGKNLSQVRRRGIALSRRRIGVVFQDHRLLMDRTVFDNVALPLVIAGVARAETGKRVRAILERVGLGGRERSLPIGLSSGEQQRVGIARAVVGRPALLLADEPTGNLDPQLAAEVMQLFATLPAQGTAVLVASHDLHLVRRLQKRVLVLDHGRLIDDYRPAVAACLQVRRLSRVPPNPMARWSATARAPAIAWSPGATSTSSAWFPVLAGLPVGPGPRPSRWE